MMSHSFLPIESWAVRASRISILNKIVRDKAIMNEIRFRVLHFNGPHIRLEILRLIRHICLHRYRLFTKWKVLLWINCKSQWNRFKNPHSLLKWGIKSLLINRISKNYMLKGTPDFIFQVFFDFFIRCNLNTFNANKMEINELVCCIEIKNQNKI